MQYRTSVPRLLALAALIGCGRHQTTQRAPNAADSAGSPPVTRQEAARGQSGSPVASPTAPWDSVRAAIGMREDALAAALSKGRASPILEFYVADATLKRRGRTAMGRDAVRTFFERLLGDGSIVFHREDMVYSPSRPMTRGRWEVTVPPHAGEGVGKRATMGAWGRYATEWIEDGGVWRVATHVLEDDPHIM